MVKAMCMCPTSVPLVDISAVATAPYEHGQVCPQAPRDPSPWQSRAQSKCLGDPNWC